MDLSDVDRRLLEIATEGFALNARPFLDLARGVGITESEAIDRLRALQACGAIKRLGLIVRHHELGYRANAMVVWDIPDDRVDSIGARMARLPFVTLCYRRRRALPDWPYNLFAMIHGTDREVVTQQINELVEQLELRETPRSILFSRRRFKQRGASYARTGETRSKEASWTISTAAS